MPCNASLALTEYRDAAEPVVMIISLGQTPQQYTDIWGDTSIILVTAHYRCG